MTFCVRCGKEGRTYESLCVDCFLANNRFTKAPDHVDLFQCYHCKEFQLRGKWQRQGLEEAIREAARDGLEVRKGADVAKVRMEVQEADPRNYHVEMRVGLEHEDLRMEEENRTTVRLKNTVCPRCSKIMGSYYESIIQVRGRERKLTEAQQERILQALQSKVEEAQAENREMFITKLEQVPGGFDAFLSSISLAKGIAHELADRHGAEVKESSTLVTQKEGRDVYRVTFLVRLPSYMRGEVVLHKGRPHLVVSITASKTKLQDLRTHEPVMMSNVDLRDARVVAKRQDVLEAVVLSESKRELQVMHPRTFATVELKKPQGFEAQGESVRVLIYEEELYLLPYASKPSIS
ncbi:MAG: NMD3-related protein [Methanomassiliicoccales archaeon]|nr:NMD3-related protein [Methanomassiliicoccales archaeon]